MDDEKKLQYNSAYISYVETGESAAVFITRDIDTKGKWIDVLNISGRKNEDGQWDIKMFSVELFPRRKHPIYPEDASIEDKKYITWETAHEDISEQRALGKKGPKFKIKVKLVNNNKGKYRIVEKCWNKTFERYVPMSWKTSSCEIRKLRVPAKPHWEYHILSIESI